MKKLSFLVTMDVPDNTNAVLCAGSIRLNLIETMEDREYPEQGAQNIAATVTVWEIKA